MARSLSLPLQLRSSPAMTTPKPEVAPPDKEALRSGLLAALGLYLAEADLTYAAGESGVVFANLQVKLEKGKVIWTKGAVFFERRFDMVARA